MYKLHYVDTDGECDKVFPNEAEVVAFANKDKEDFYGDEWAEDITDFKEAVYYLDTRDIEVIKL